MKYFIIYFFKLYFHVLLFIMSLQRMVRHSLFSLPQFIERNQGTLERGNALTKFWNSFVGVLYSLDMINIVMTLALQL